MKKVLSTIMALTMISSTLASANVFADDKKLPDATCIGYTETDLDVPVGADVEGGTAPELSGDKAEEIENDIVDITGNKSKAKIYVEVEWDELMFIYDFGTVSEYEWDLDSLDYVPRYSYVNGECAGWEKETADITFTNYSNRDVFAGVSFEMNKSTDVYDDVTVTFDKYEDILESAVGKDKENLPEAVFQMSVSGEPENSIAKGNAPSLGSLKFYISEEARLESTKEKLAAAANASGEHEHHYVYDQFGRLVCTGCNDVKHVDCIDEDEDGLCDECGLERDFCPDCHIGGTCRCT